MYTYMNKSQKQMLFNNDRWQEVKRHKIFKKIHNSIMGANRLERERDINLSSREIEV